MSVLPNELYHHGRLGQHWGKRNGPPYPLSSKTVKKKYKGKLTDEDKKRLINEGTATELLRHEKELSTEDIKSAIKRIETSNKLSQLSKSELDAGWNTINSVMKKVGNIKDWTKNASEMYKAIDDISTVYKKRHS